VSSLFSLVIAVAVATTSVVTPSPVQDDITVIGQRLTKWIGKYEIRGSRMKCKTKSSTGDNEIDAIGCQSFETCASKLQTRIDASDVKDLDKPTRLAMKEAIKRDLHTCVVERRDVLIADLADRRFQARQR
jgi:hypothetical protein